MTKKRVSFKGFQEGCFYSVQGSMRIYYIQDGLPTGTHVGSDDSEITVPFLRKELFELVSLPVMIKLDKEWTKTFKEDIKKVLKQEEINIKEDLGIKQNIIAIID